MSNLKTFKTLDDALRTLHSLVSTPLYHPLTTPASEQSYAIRPARYDRSAICNITAQVDNHRALTDRQQQLAVKLVTKYRKQWVKNGYDVSNIDIKTPTELPLRTDVDRRRLIDIMDDMIIVRFPYIPSLITKFGEYAHTRSCGKIEWNRDDRRWQMSATPDNTTWISRYAKEHDFKTTKEFEQHVDNINNQYDFNDIKLDIINNELVLNDAPESMLDWIKSNTGDIHMNNFLHIVSLAGRLAFTLSTNVIAKVKQDYPDNAHLILHRLSHVSDTDTNNKDFFKQLYELDQRLVVIYMANSIASSDEFDVVRKGMPGYSVTVCTDQTNITIDSNVNNVIITNKVLPIIPDVIVSTVGFMTGPNRRSWFNSATKNIYYCADIDDRIKKHIKKYESNLSN